MDSNHTCLAAISLDSAVKKDGNDYAQVFLKECKYIEQKVVRHITDGLESFSDDSDDSDDSDEEQVNVKLMFLEKTIFENIFFENVFWMPKQPVNNKGC